MINDQVLQTKFEQKQVKNLAWNQKTKKFMVYVELTFTNPNLG
jgi:hypothetical protein